jgi:ABC-2 type transport system ATP-binding protein
MSGQVLRIEHLSHRYNSTWAIRDINLAVSRTGILGLLGSNGAGKSTTMNIICGVLSQTEGDVFIDGINMRANPEATKRKLGFLPQTPPLYMDFTVNEYLRYCARLRLVPDNKISAYMDYAKERCGINHFSHRLIRNLSGGYRQRVGIAQAIIHQPQLVILDEPTNGLDPNQILEVRALIKEIASERTVVLSSHILSEIQVLCHDIVMIEAGRIVFSDTMDAFNNYLRPCSVWMHMNNPPSTESIMLLPGVTNAEMLTEKQMRVHFNTGPEITATLINAGMENNWQLREIMLDKYSMEEIFAKLSNKTT